MWAALNAKSLTVAAGAAWGHCVSDLVADLDRICGHRNQLVADIQEALLAHPLVNVLISMRRFGLRTGARTLAESGDPYRFADGSRLSAYIRLAPID